MQFLTKRCDAGMHGIFVSVLLLFSVQSPKHFTWLARARRFGLCFPLKHHFSLLFILYSSFTDPLFPEDDFFHFSFSYSTFFSTQSLSPKHFFFVSANLQCILQVSLPLGEPYEYHQSILGTPYLDTQDIMYFLSVSTYNI